MLLFYFFWGMAWFWWLIWVIFLIWIFATPWGYRRYKNSDTPLDILNRRYANGEIDEEEFRRRKLELLRKD